MVNEHDLARAQQALRNGERTYDIIGYHAASIADHVGIAFFQSQQATRLDTRIHTRNDCRILAGRQWLMSVGKFVRVVFVVYQKVVDG
jgi:hypothetical protein